MAGTVRLHLRRGRPPAPWRTAGPRVRRSLTTDP